MRKIIHFSVELCLACSIQTQHPLPHTNILKSREYHILVKHVQHIFMIPQYYDFLGCEWHEDW